MKKIYILTSGFPYGSSETFLKNELAYFPNAKIVSSYIGNVESIQTDIQNHNNIEVLHPDSNFFKGKRLSRICSAIKSIFTLLFWEELHSNGIRPLNFKKALQLLSCISKANELVKYLEKEISKNMQTDDQFVFYAYWMNQLALAAIILAKKHGGIAVSRCHGYDLYKRVENNQYVTLQAYLTEHLDGIFPISQNGKDTLISLFPNREDIARKIVVSRLGTLNNGLSPLCKSDLNFTIVSCSNVVALKRIDLIIDSLCLINSFQIHWIHFGDGPLLLEMQSKIKRINTNHILEMRGYKSNSDILKFYKDNHVDLFINASESEGIPVSIMEALSFGIPCLATDVGGVHEIIQNDFNGLLIKQDECTAQNIADKIIEIRNRLLSDTGSALQLNARNSWAKNYSAELNYSIFAQNINNLIS